MLPLFWFVIPVRSRQSARDWNVVCGNLRVTINSILRQTDPRCRVIVSCEERPGLDGVDDPRLTIVARNYPSPTSFAEAIQDKRSKIRCALTVVRAGGGGYVMPVDADDIISKSLVSYVLGDDNRIGYYVVTGYGLFSKTAKVTKIDDFYKRCGTSYVLHFDVTDLPFAPHAPPALSDAFKNHRRVLEIARSHNRMLSPLPFPAVIYRMETGENLSSLDPRVRPFSKQKFAMTCSSIWRSLQKRRSLPIRLRDEFGDLYYPP